MSEQHLYISASDKYLADVIQREIGLSRAHVVELGCGPGRILPIVRRSIPNAHITAIEADEVFANYAESWTKNLDIKIILDDVEFCTFDSPVDVFYSQGFHHHVSKERKTRAYLQNIYNQLAPGGIYVLSDEFLPEYANENEREQRAIVWYSHIIAHALLHGYEYLAREEAKTLLDDIYEGRSSVQLKNNAQINFVLSKVTIIDNYARTNQKDKLAVVVADFQHFLETHHSLNLAGDVTLDLSRHDYKICERILISQIESAGFKVEEVSSFGPLKNIGAMSVYILRK
jgi:SAM-dependent methyltransferase